MRPLLLFAPGAGAPSSSAWMTRWAEALQSVGRVVRFDYPYQRAGRARPDPLPVLIEAHAEALAGARGPQDGAVVLVGKSMGGRVGCHLSLEVPVAGLVCFGYPLIAASGGKSREGVLLALRTPVLFAQGTRDRLCPLHALERVRPRMETRSVLHVVDGGDHSLDVTRTALMRAGEDQAAVDRGILSAVEDFVGSL